MVVGEFLGGESGGGLGYLIIQSLGTLNAADMMVALIALGVIGIVMALGIKQIEKRLLRWRPAVPRPHVKRWVWLTAGLLVLLGLDRPWDGPAGRPPRLTGLGARRRGDRVAGGVDPVGLRRRLAAHYGALERYDGALFTIVAVLGGIWQYRILRAQGAGAGARGIRGGPAGLARRRPGPERSARPMKTREDAADHVRWHRTEARSSACCSRPARSQAAVMTIAAGADGGPEEEHGGDQIVYLIEGEAIVRIDAHEHHAQAGTLITIPAGARHHVRNPGSSPLFFLTVTTRRPRYSLRLPGLIAWLPAWQSGQLSG